MLPRKFLNQDEELLAELRPHWVFLFGPLFTSLGTWAVIVVIVVLWHSAPGWTNYPFIILAVIPGLWLLGRYIRWRSYIIALTSTRVLVRQGITGRDTVQLRLQRIVEVNLRQSLIERMLGCGSLLIDVQGEDDSLTLEYVRKPAIVQRVINSQINEIVGGGEREADPGVRCSRGTATARPYADRDTDETGLRRRRAVRRRPRRRGARHAPLRRRREHRGPDAAAERRRPHRRPPPPPRPPPASRYGTGSLSSTTCASAASSPRRSSPPRRAELLNRI